jgi:hypothetical protein
VIEPEENHDDNVSHKFSFIVLYFRCLVWGACVPVVCQFVSKF